MEMRGTSAGNDKWAGLAAIGGVLVVIVVWAAAFFGFMGNDSEVRGITRYRSNVIQVEVPAGWVNIKTDVVLTESVTNRFRDPQQRSNVLTIDTRPAEESAVVRANDIANELGDAVQFGPIHQFHGRFDTWYIIYADATGDNEMVQIILQDGACMVDVLAGGAAGWDVAWHAVDTLTDVRCPL